MGRFTDQYWGRMWNSSSLCPLAVCGSSWWGLSINSFQSFTLNHPFCMLYLSFLSLIPGVKILILSPRPLPSPFISINLKQSPLLNLLLLLSLPDLSVPTRSQDHKAPGSASSLCSQGEPVGGLWWCGERGDQGVSGFWESKRLWDSCSWEALA